MRCITHFFLLALVSSMFLTGRSISIQTASRSATAVDLTLVSGSTGEDVVDACISKLNSRLTLSNDLGLMKRIAYVESAFGNSTAAENNLGGIWQITSSIQQQLLTSSAQLQLFRILVEASLMFGSDVADMSNADFRVPLRSALAARLYIELLAGSSNLPESLSDQASWWATNYNTSQSAAIFQTLVTTFENISSCQVSKMDIWFLIDGSGSIGIDNFNTTLQFVENLSAKFPISLNQVRAGFSVYSDYHTIYSRFDEHASNDNFTQLVNSTSYYGGGTNTGAAISDVVTNGFNESFGLRSLSEGVPRVLIVLTDGHSHDSVIAPAQAARNKSISVFAVGVGSGTNENEINEIASDPNTTHAFNFRSFSALVDVLQQSLSTETCKISAQIPDNTSVAITVPPGNTYYSAVQLPNNGSIELVFKIGNNSGKGIVYISATASNPSSALFDLSFVLTQKTTVITINAGDASTDITLAGLHSRSKRSISSTALYVALKADSSAPLELTFQATGDFSKAVVTDPTTAAVSLTSSILTTSSSSTTATISLAFNSTAAASIIPLSTTSGSDTFANFSSSLLMLMGIICYLFSS